MKLEYKLMHNFDQKDKQFLDKFNINVDVGFDVVGISGDSPCFQQIKEYFSKDWESIATSELIFESKELQSAKYLNIYADKYLGYAKPDTGKEVEGFEYPFDVYPYYKDVFEIMDTDKEYGVLRGNQIGCYMLNGEPKWGKAGVASVHYAEDAFFSSINVYEKIFQPLGILSKPVLNYKTKQPLETIVQLIQQGISKSDLNIEQDYIKEIEYVESWSLKKYILTADKPYPIFIESPGDFDFFYTKEYFGSGGFTQRGTIISQKLYSILIKNKVTGLNYMPLIPYGNYLISSHKIHNGKEYTQEEWEKYEQEQWEKYKKNN